MMLKLRSSITLKMAMLVAGGTSLVLSLVLAYSYAYSRKLILEEAENTARNLALSVARRIEQEFRAVGKVPKNFACFFETSAIDSETLARLLRRAVADNPEIFGCAVAFEPYSFKPNVRAYAPYCFRTASGMTFVELGAQEYHYFQRDWYQIPHELRTPCLEPTLF
jgi:phosphoserine phosphatase RsbU/P